jgi:hypothetical protein
MGYSRQQFYEIRRNFEQVVGSSIVTEYEEQDGKPVLVREPKIFFIDDKGGKPIGINLCIGKRPYRCRA